MTLKERLQRNLVTVRQASERLLADFKSPQQWVFQVHPSCNHALWFAGHMAQVDNFFISLVAPQRARDLPGYPGKFGMGSQPTGSPEDYPPPESVVATMRERRRVLLEVLADMSDDDLAKKLPAGTPDFLSDVGSVFETAIWHEGQHSGQISITRRAMGHKPLQ
ncbi:MAG: DinB family protein [Planctomycetaceae bacterium]|nr:DinB family protein [Planctomycetaceae bacterium]